MRVVICEDDVLVADGLARLLRDAGEQVCADVRDGDGLRAAVDRHHPDLAIVDARAVPELRDRIGRTAVLVLAADVVAGVRPRRGFGYLLKTRVLEVEPFLAAARTVAAGGTVLDPELSG